MEHAALISVATVQAIERVYRTRYAYFLRVARAELGELEPAADAVQEAFARAIRGRHSYRGSGSLDAWIWRILINVCQTARGQTLHDRSGRALESPVLERDDYRHLRDAFRQLSERQRLALFLRHYADLEYGRIGEILGVERGTVAATLHAAHMRLRTILMEASNERDA